MPELVRPQAATGPLRYPIKGAIELMYGSGDGEQTILADRLSELRRVLQQQHMTGHENVLKRLVPLAGELDKSVTSGYYKQKGAGTWRDQAKGGITDHERDLRDREVRLCALLRENPDIIVLADGEGAVYATVTSVVFRSALRNERLETYQPATLDAYSGDVALPVHGDERILFDGRYLGGVALS